MSTPPALPPALVIFDCDGVLVDSEVLTAAVASRLLTELGWTITPRQIAQQFMGRTQAYLWQRVAEHLGEEVAHLYEELSVAELVRV